MSELDKRTWWKTLDPTWKRLFKLALDINHTPSDEELTDILELEVIDCSSSRIISVDPLQHLTRLRKLICSNTRLRSIEKLRPLRLLDEVDISRTEITSLEPLEGCASLWSLKCNKTPVKSLHGLEGLQGLAYLDCSETTVSSLAPLLGLLKLRQVNCHLSQVSETSHVQQLTAIGVDVNYTLTPLDYEEIRVRIDKETKEAEVLAVLERDSLFEEAARVIVTHQQGSTSLLQRRLNLGYNRANLLINQLEHYGIVGPFYGTKAREVLILDEYSLELLLNTLPHDINEQALGTASQIINTHESGPVYPHGPATTDKYDANFLGKLPTEGIRSNQLEPMPSVKFSTSLAPLASLKPQPNILVEDASPSKTSIWERLAHAFKLITG